MYTLYKSSLFTFNFTSANFIVIILLYSLYLKDTVQKNSDDI